ncbi:MAG: ABC transporter permease [Niabella sp.]
MYKTIASAVFKLWSTIKKDWRILVRDRVGLILMFAMPIVLAIVIAMVQNSTYELVTNKKIPLLLLNKDAGEAGQVLEQTIDKGGMFTLKKISSSGTDSVLKAHVQNKEALVGMIIPPTYTNDILLKSENISAKALQIMSVDDAETEAAQAQEKNNPVIIYFHPVLQASFRQGIDGAMNSILQIVQSKYIVRQLYSGINDNATIPDTLENQILSNQTPIQQFSVSKDGTAPIPNATQHNIPAWTVFAMFFIVISLGSSIVREKNSGSFLRLKTLPTPLSLSIVSKQVTYIIITILQAIVIFAIGKWLFPVIGLPALNMPQDKLGLLLVIFICGWCATSFAIFIGVFAKTQEQSNGIGAISIVLFAAIGGLLVPAFAMPESFQTIMRFSPLHWCLEVFYGLFLEGGTVKDTIRNLVPVLLIICVLQFAAWAGMRRLKYV